MSKADNNSVGDSGLLPCPFCNAPAQTRGDAYEGFVVGCSGDCEPSPQTCANHDVKYSIAAWNTRADSQPVPQNEAALSLLLDEACRAVTLTGEDYWAIPREIYNKLRVALGEQQ